MKIEFQDHIDDYLLGKMSEEDSKSFEQEMKNDNELREQVEFTKAAQTATKSRNEKLTKIQEWDDDYKWSNDRRVATAQYHPTGSGYNYSPVPPSENTFIKSRSSRKNFLYLISGIAAIFIAGFLLFNNAFYGSKSHMEITYCPLQMEYGSMRGGNSFENIEKLLIGKDYKSALSKIEKEEKNLKKYAIIADSIDDEDQREYEKNVIRLYHDELIWMKVFALVGLNRRKDAIVVLEELRAKDNAFKEQADSLYYLIK